MKDLASRLIWARERRQLSQTALAKLAKVSQSNIGNLESGTRQSSRKVVELAQVLGVSADWLATGRGDPEDGPHSVQRLSEPVAEGYARLEMLDATPYMGSDGVPVDFPEVIQHVDVLREYLMMELGANPEHLCLLPVRGDSMSGTIEHGDLVFVDKTVRGFDGDGVYVVIWSGGLVVKRIQGLMDGGLQLISDNSKYPAKDVKREDVCNLTICARVVGSWKVRRI